MLSDKASSKSGIATGKLSRNPSGPTSQKGKLEKIVKPSGVRELGLGIGVGGKNLKRQITFNFAVANEGLHKTQMTKEYDRLREKYTNGFLNKDDVARTVNIYYGKGDPRVKPAIEKIMSLNFKEKKMRVLAGE